MRRSLAAHLGVGEWRLQSVHIAGVQVAMHTDWARCALRCNRPRVEDLVLMACVAALRLWCASAPTHQANPVSAALPLPQSALRLSGCICVEFECSSQVPQPVEIRSGDLVEVTVSAPLEVESYQF